MSVDKLLDNMKSKEDFIFFMRCLLNDNQVNIEEWENKDIPLYLESIASWVEDMEGYYQNMGLEIPANIDWKFIATLFYVGKIYE